MLRKNTLYNPHRCCVCGVEDFAPKKGKKCRSLIEMHHITPKSEGGSNDAWNVCPLCSSCHSKVHLGHITLERWLYSTKGWIMIWNDTLEDLKHFGIKNSI